MANEQNLIPNGYKLTLEEQKKGGKKSGEVRRKRADMRKAAQAILDGVYKTEDGAEITGAELLVMTLLEIAKNKKNKQAIPAIKLLMELTGNNRTEEDVKKLNAEIKLLEAKAKLMNGGSSSVEDLTILAEMLKDDRTDD